MDPTDSFTHVLTRPAAADLARGLLRSLRSAGWAALALLALGWLNPAWAQAPQVEQLLLQRTPEGLFMSARFEVSPHGAVQDALLKGVPLYFVWQADVMRKRWYWTDKRVAGATRTLRLAYQPLTRRWRVSISTETAGGAGGGAGLPYALHQNHDTLDEALAAVGRVSRWQLADASQLGSEGDATHRVEFGFRLDLSLLPRPFQIGLGNQPEWSMALERELAVPAAATPEPPMASEPRAPHAAAEPVRAEPAPSAESPAR